MSIYAGQWKLKTAATARPVSYAEAKQHLRIFHDDEKTLIESLIKAATNYCQDIQNRAYVTQTWELTFDRFPADGSPIYLPRAPLKTLNSIKYNDTADGTQQTWSSALWDSVTRAVPGYIVPAYGESYPSARLHPESIIVDYDAGYGASSAVPEEVINKPGALSDDEFEYIREHPVVGERIISQLSFMAASLPMIRGHHERIDGRGYPDRLKGDEIPLGARIIAVADAFIETLAEAPQPAVFSA